MCTFEYFSRGTFAWKKKSIESVRQSLGAETNSINYYYVIFFFSHPRNASALRTFALYTLVRPSPNLHAPKTPSRISSTAHFVFDLTYLFTCSSSEIDRSETSRKVAIINHTPPRASRHFLNATAAHLFLTIDEYKISNVATAAGPFVVERNDAVPVPTGNMRF